MTVENMFNAAQKTPISLLQELCAQQGLTPDYKLISVEGAVHAPTFMYRVQVGEVVATATGASKKKAKHAVAKAVLEKLLTKEGGFENGFVSDGVVITIESLEKFAVEAAPIPATEESMQGNPVGALQEHCMKKRWQPPLYETQRESGLPHERVFTISCQVERLTEKGEGKSKKLAKRVAAERMLQRLLKLEEVTVSDDDKDEKLEEGAKCATEDVSSVKSDSDDEECASEVTPCQEAVQEPESTDISTCQKPAQESESTDTTCREATEESESADTVTCQKPAQESESTDTTCGEATQESESTDTVTCQKVAQESKSADTITCQKFTQESESIDTTTCQTATQKSELKEAEDLNQSNN